MSSAAVSLFFSSSLPHLGGCHQNNLDPRVAPSKFMVSLHLRRLKSLKLLPFRSKYIVLSTHPFLRANISQPLVRSINACLRIIIYIYYMCSWCLRTWVKTTWHANIYPTLCIPTKSCPPPQAMTQLNDKIVDACRREKSVQTLPGASECKLLARLLL